MNLESFRLTRPVEAGLILFVFASAWGACLATFAVQGDLPGDFAGDTNRAFIPFRAYLMRMLATRNFPDLAPGMFLGQPVMSFGQVSPLYPTSLAGLLVPLSHHKFFLLDLWLHLTLSSTAAAVFIRGRGRSLAAAVIAGWVYTNSSAVLFRAFGHWTLLHQAAWLPFVLLVWERLGAVRQNSRMPAALAGLLGVMLLSHNPQWLLVLMLLLGFMELFRMFMTRHVIPVPSRIASYMLCVILAATLGAVTTGPMIFGFSSSFRRLLAGIDMASAYDLSPPNLISVIFPYALFGDTPFQFRGNWSPVESAAILGRGAVVLSLVGMLTAFAQPRTLLRRNALPLCLIVGALLFGTMPSMPWFAAVVEHVPLFGSFRSWGRVSIFLILGLVMFSANGFDKFMGTAMKPRLCASAIAALLLCAGAGLLWLMDSAPGNGLLLLVPARHSLESQVSVVNDLNKSLWRDVIWYCAWTIAGLSACIMLRRVKYPWLVTVSLFAMLASESLLFQRFSFRSRAAVLQPASTPELSGWLKDQRSRLFPAPYTTAFIAPELINFGLHFEGVRSPTGADVNMRAPYAVWLNEVQGYKPNSYQLDSHLGMWTPELLDVTGLRSVVETTTDSTDTLRLGRYNARFVRQELPYAELVHANRNTTASGHIKVTEWNEDHAEIQVSAESDSFVRVREFPDNNWRARVNHHAERILTYRNNLLVPVKAGQHVIEVQYIDTVARVSFFISLGAWLVYFSGLAEVIRRHGSGVRRKKTIALPGASEN